MGQLPIFDNASSVCSSLVGRAKLKPEFQGRKGGRKCLDQASSSERGVTVAFPIKPQSDRVVQAIGVRFALV